MRYWESEGVSEEEQMRWAEEADVLEDLADGRTEDRNGADSAK